MSRNLIIAAIVIIAVVGGVVLLAGQQSKQSATSTPTSQPEAGQSLAETPTPSPTEVMQKEEGATEEAAMTEKASIEIKNFAFVPKTLTVKKGTAITFTNQDPVGHTATADDGSFDTGLIAAGESESVTFDKAGIYTYHCAPHPYMKATIVVE